MVSSLDFTELEKLTNKQKIDSHNSQLTNLRIHELEMALDQWRIRMYREPTHENIIGCFAVIKAWFSYVQSIDQYRNSKKKQADEDTFRIRVTDINKKMLCAEQYVACFQKNIVEEEIKKVYKELGTHTHNNKFWRTIEHKLMSLVNEIIDDMRTIYQGMNFYFRTSKDQSAVGGILGDLIQAKKVGNKSVEVQDEHKGQDQPITS